MQPARVGHCWSSREVRKIRPTQSICTNMAAFVSGGCTVIRKPWRKLGCGDDNGALSTHKAHQSRLLSWLVLTQGSQSPKQLRVNANKGQAEQSITSSLTALRVAVNITERAVGPWGCWAQVESGFELEARTFHFHFNSLQSHRFPFSLLPHALLLCFPLLIYSPYLMWQPPPLLTLFQAGKHKGAMDHLTSLAEWIGLANLATSQVALCYYVTCICYFFPISMANVCIQLYHTKRIDHAKGIRKMGIRNM